MCAFAWAGLFRSRILKHLWTIQLLRKGNQFIFNFFSDIEDAGEEETADEE